PFVNRQSIRVSDIATAIGYTGATGAPPAPTSGSLPLQTFGTPTTVNDGCAAFPVGSLVGKAVLIRRGTCTFYAKAFNAQAAGASAVVLYNNAAGILSARVTGTPPITIPVVAVDQLLESRPKSLRELGPQRVLGILQNSAQPHVWSGNPTLGLLDNVHRQGAGMLDIRAAIEANAEITPSKLSLGESQAGAATR